MRTGITILAATLAITGCTNDENANRVVGELTSDRYELTAEVGEPITAFNVVARGLGAITKFIERGVERGEFRREALDHQPHLFLAPMMLSMIWRLIFTNKPLNTDRLMESQVDMLLAQLKA